MSELIHMSFAKVYKFKQCTFEWHDYLGPQPINRGTLEPLTYSVGFRYWSSISKFSNLPNKEKQKFRIY